MSNQKTKHKKAKSDFIIKISDGYCEWEFGFNGRHFCIRDIVNLIEKGLGIKNDYEKLIGSSFNSDSDELLTANTLKKIHPFLTDEQAKSLLDFCNSKTIDHVVCYGNGTIMFPMWIESCE